MMQAPIESVRAMAKVATMIAVTADPTTDVTEARDQARGLADTTSEEAETPSIAEMSVLMTTGGTWVETVGIDLAPGMAKGVEGVGMMPHTRMITVEAGLCHVLTISFWAF